MTTPAISVCVLDDHPMIAEGICRLIEATEDIVVAGVARTPAELDGLLGQNRVDVALIDVRLENGNGLDVCQRLRQRFPDLRVLMISSFSDIALVRRAFAVGASGFALKSIALDMLPAAIRKIRDGGTFVSSELLVESIPVPATAAQDSEGLSRREREIVHMVAAGRSNKEIARDLGLSAHTIKLHVSRLLKRFKLRRRTQLARFAEDG